MTREDIARILEEWTGVPATNIVQEEAERLLNLEGVLHERVVGQEPAVRAVAEAIRRARAGIKDPKRPVGSFIFLGPTGVGKTELARTLAEYLFGEEDAMIRIDMSEFQERHTVSQARRRASRATSATRRPDSSPSRSGAARTRSSSSTRSRRPTRTSSTRCCRSWTTGA